MVAPRRRVTPNRPSLAPTLSPPTGRSIKLIASARGATSTADKWASPATRAPVRLVHVHTRAVIHAGFVLCPRTIWSR